MNQGVIHPLDKLINDNSLIMLEAMVPFVDYRLKKLLIIYIKYRELSLLMSSLNDTQFIDGCGFNKSTSSSEDMLLSLLSAFSPDSTASISNAKKMMSMMQTMESLNNNFDFPPDIPTTPDYNNTPNPDTPQDVKSTASLYDSILNIIENEGEI